MDEAEARQRLERMVAASSEPVLDSTAVDDLVADAKRPDPTGNLPTNVASAPTWAPSTTYVYGAVVTANPPAGRWWRCVLGGISGTTQPAWPTIIGPRSCAQVTETAVVWEDAGGPWAPTWDLDAAAARGWETKAGLAAEDFEFTTDAQTFRRQQVIDHCERKAAQHRRRVVASAPMG